MTCREGIINGEAKIEAFLTNLAVDKEVLPSTQNQAMNALVFLYKQMLFFEEIQLDFRKRRR